VQKNRAYTQVKGKKKGIILRKGVGTITVVALGGRSSREEKMRS